MRTARKLWVSLVTAGIFCILAAIATNLTAVIFPHWMEYSKANADVYPNRGVLESCKGTFGSECQTISNPWLLYHDCILSSGICDEAQQKRTNVITRLRIVNWTLPVAALGLETITSFACIFYLLAVRYCMSKPSAQSAQSCLAVSGYLLWLSAITTVIGIISFEGTSTFEGITTNIKIKGMAGMLRQEDLETLERNYGLSSYLSWASAGLGVAASWLWIAASFVQPPPHISNPSIYGLTTSSTAPLYPLTPKQQDKQKATI
ncbi:unnamed protein product [Hymenolepis diminuta]|uniref:Uncharacterized protein n=1 Tax=Hymenolepis diminuta TaxID=6216 RepID=A0A564YAJ0_HYMDI|nr:unnamed protein product [Hymenolepis diminuta]